MVENRQKYNNMSDTKYVNYTIPTIDAGESETEDEVVASSTNLYLSIMWKCNKIVASYYNNDQKMLYTIMETIDSPPRYPALEALIREITPKHIIAMGKLVDPFIQALIKFVRNESNEHSDFYVSLPPKITLLDLKEFTYEACLHHVRNLNIQSAPTELEPGDRLNYIKTLITITSNKTLHTLGALIKFLEKTWYTIRPSEEDLLIFLHLSQYALENHVFIDATTFNALNVFNQMKHDSTFKYGGFSSCREGISLYRLLSSHCISKMGFIKMREILMCPLKNPVELKKRYDFMDFIMDPRNVTVREAIGGALRKIVNVYKIFNRLKHSQGNNGHWRGLYNTIYAILQLNQEIKPFVNKCTIFREYADKILENLYNLEACIDDTLDLKSGLGRERPTIKDFIDTELDEAKNKKRAIKNRLVAAARIVVNHLPPHLEECSMSYVPDMGHILGVHKWPNCHPEDLLQYGLYYMFETHDMYHFKNALCQELDTQLGDLPSIIQDHENRIIQRIAIFVINENYVLMNPLEHLIYMDALISMAKVGMERNYIRPVLNENNMLEIKGGRHPLAELFHDNFVPNHYSSGGLHKPIKILTGPNASGKSMYMKQTALIVYMAHVGSYIPATAANISMIHSIHSRLHETESAAVHFSAFMTDLCQMGNALYNAKPSSLILMDEFGRGSTGNVSKALLTGAIRHFLKDAPLCPHVIISTHLYLEKEYFNNLLVHYQTMSHIVDAKTSIITFLYKIQDGESSSFTFEMAQMLLPSILQRGKQINAMLESDNPELNPIEENIFYLDIKCPPFDK